MTKTKILPAVDQRVAVAEIARAWSQTIDSLLNTANLLFTYSQQANWRAIREQLQVDGVMGASVISMMLSIGRDPRLHQPSIKQLLPPSYNTLYLLTKLDDAVIDAKIKDDALTPALTVQEVRAWSNQKVSSNGNTAPNPSKDKFVLHLPNKFGTRDKDRLLKLLQSVAKQFPGVEVA
jgi:hypothetical protein